MKYQLVCFHTQSMASRLTLYFEIWNRGWDTRFTLQQGMDESLEKMENLSSLELKVSVYFTDRSAKYSGNQFSVTCLLHLNQSQVQNFSQKERASQSTLYLAKLHSGLKISIDRLPNQNSPNIYNHLYYHWSTLQGKGQVREWSWSPLTSFIYGLYVAFPEDCANMNNCVAIPEQAFSSLRLTMSSKPYSITRSLLYPNKFR